jgi:hypothetical protein
MCPSVGKFIPLCIQTTNYKEAGQICIMILASYDSCKSCHLSEQIAENPTELGLEFVAVAPSLAQKAPNLSPNDS